MFWLSCVLLALYVGVFLVTVAQGFIRAPFGDAYDFLTIEFRAQDAHDPGRYLWTPHNGHHLVWIRLLTTLDVRLFHGQSTIFVIVALFALLAITGLLCRETVRAAPTRGLGLALAGVPPLALLTTLNSIDVSIPINTVYVLSLAFVVAALLLYEAGDARLATGLAVLALVAGSAMGNSIGLAAVPALMAAAWRRPDRAHRALLCIAGPMLVALFLFGAGPPSVEAALPPQTLVEHSVRVLRYFFEFCALPWSASSTKLALPGHFQAIVNGGSLALGVAVAALGSCLVIRPAKPGVPRQRVHRLCCDLITFSFVAAAMAAVGRADASASLMVPVRYALLVAPLHIGVIVLVVLRTSAAGRSSPALVLAALSLVLAASLGHQLAGRWLIERYDAKLRHAIAAFDAGERSPELTEYIYPGLSHAEQVSAEMKRRGVYQ